MIIELNGMELSSVPTANHKQLLHIRISEDVKQKLSEAEKQTQNPKDMFEITVDKNHMKAFVDPSELSYNSFENILQMDDCFFGLNLKENHDLKISIDNLDKQTNYFRFELTDHENLLIELHKLDLYTLPFNNLSRGGKRMIFSSLKLADTLTKQLRDIFKKFQGYESQNLVGQFGELCSDFNSVNHVFRLNSFSPNCGNFKSHYDTPFSDQQRKLYSKFTLLIYLTGGSNYEKYSLRIEDQKINKIPAFTGIIFDQRYEHEGWPYLEDEKVFLRTELIYSIRNVDSDERVAEMFNKACYFQKEAYYEHGNQVFADELQKYSNDLFNHTAKLRYLLGEKKEQLCLTNRVQINEGKYLLKKYLDTVYVTDGNSFWFKDSIPVQFAAQLVLADYFNGRMKLLSSKPGDKKESLKIKSKPFKLRLGQKSNYSNGNQIKMQIQGHQNPNYSDTIDAQIIEYLDDITFDDEAQPLQYPYIFANIVDSGNQDFDIQKYHCSLEDPQDYVRSLYSEIEARGISLGRLKTKMEGVAVILFNGKLHIDESSIKVSNQRGEVSFNGAFFNKSINFASCQCDSYRIHEFIEKETVEIEGFLLPKMKYHKFNNCKGFKLSIDMFKNGFIHRINANVSRPYAHNPRYGEIEIPFYDEDDQYIDSDEDFDEQTGKRRSEDDEEMEEENERKIRKIRK